MKRFRRWLTHRPIRSQYPIFFFGHRLVIHAGLWLNIEPPHRWLVINFKRCYAYISKDDTPRNRTWGIGHFNNYS